MDRRTGAGLLAVIDLTFDNRWVYLYELVQNALDVGASSIADSHLP